MIIMKDIEYETDNICRCLLLLFFAVCRKKEAFSRHLSSDASYISTKHRVLIGCSRRKNKNCNITIGIMDFEETSLKLGLWRTTKIDEKKT